MDVSISSSETKGMVLFKELKINNRTLSIKAILRPPKRPPNNLFRIPRAAKSASLVNAFPARETTKTMTTNVMAKSGDIYCFFTPFKTV